MIKRLSAIVHTLLNMLRPDVLPVHAAKFMRSAIYHLHVWEVSGKQSDGLNLGSGGARIGSLCNIDASPWALCDVIAGIERLKLKSNSVSTIYSSHVFEHIPKAKAQGTLAEWHRVLKPGGRLYLCVPDLEILFRVYLDNVPNYTTEEGKYLVDLACGVTYGGQKDRYDIHYYGYSFTTLKSALEGVGFTNVQRFDRATLQFAPLKDASLAKFEVGTLSGLSISLNIEASK